MADIQLVDPYATPAPAPAASKPLGPIDLVDPYTPENETQAPAETARLKRDDNVVRKAQAIGNAPADIVTSNFMRQFIPLGLSDKLMAGVQSLAGKGDFNDILRRAQEAEDAYKEDNPGTALATEVAGGLTQAALTGNGAGLISKIPGFAAGSTAAKGGLSMLGALGNGAAYGYNQARVDENPLLNAGKNGVLSMGLNAAGQVFGGIGRLFEQPVQKGMRMLSDTISKSGKDPEQVAGALERIGKPTPVTQGLSGMDAFADPTIAGSNVKPLINKALKFDTIPRQDVATRYTMMNRNAQDDLTRLIGNTVTNSPNPAQKAAAIVPQLEQDVKNAYSATRNLPVFEDKALTDFVTTPGIRSKIFNGLVNGEKEIYKDSQGNLVHIPTMGPQPTGLLDANGQMIMKPGNGQFAPAMVVDMDKNFRNYAHKLYENTEGQQTLRPDAVADIARELRGIVEKSPMGNQAKGALQAYYTSRATQDALNNGQKFADTATKEVLGAPQTSGQMARSVSHAFDEASNEGAADMYRLGAGASLQERFRPQMTDAPSTWGRGLAPGTGLNDKVNLILRDDPDAAKVFNHVTRQRAMMEEGGQAFGGAAGEALTKSNPIWEAVKRGATGIGAGILGHPGIAAMQGLSAGEHLAMMNTRSARGLLELANLPPQELGAKLRDYGNGPLTELIGPVGAKMLNSTAAGRRLAQALPGFIPTQVETLGGDALFRRGAYDRARDKYDEWKNDN